MLLSKKRVPSIRGLMKPHKDPKELADAKAAAEKEDWQSVFFFCSTTKTCCCRTREGKRRLGRAMS